MHLRAALIGLGIGLAILVLHGFAPTGFSQTFMLTSAAAAVVCVYLIAGGSGSSDPMEPVKLAALIFLMAFVISPPFALAEGVYDDRFFAFAFNAENFEFGMAVVLLAILSLAAGHFAYTALSDLASGSPAATDGQPPRVVLEDTTPVRTIGLLLACVGAIAYVALIVLSGGIGYVMAFTGARSLLFEATWGGVYWAIFFLLAGSMVLAAQLITRHRIMVLIGVVAVACAYALLQGRSLMLAPLFGLAFIHHYRVRAVRWWQIVLGSIGALVLASMLGAYRMTDKTIVYSDFPQFLADFFGNLGTLATWTFFTSIEQFEMVMVAVLSVDRGEPLLGGSTLLAWLEPVDRLLRADLLDTVQPGAYLLQVIHPEFANLPTAASPSLPGELYVNFGVAGVICGMFVLGLLLAALYQPLRRGTATTLYLAFATYTTWILGKSLVDGTVLLFKLAVFATPLLLLLTLLPRQNRIVAGHVPSAPSVPRPDRPARTPNLLW